jgi:hypothetical protein
MKTFLGLPIGGRMFRLISVVFVLFAPSLLAQVAPSNRSPNGKTLITVSVRPDRSDIHPGDDLGVEVTLKVGPDGAYVPNFFGDFMQTCEKGFWSDIFTPQGKIVSEPKASCAHEEIFGRNSAKELLAERYVFLKSREDRRWRATLTGITKSPGSYEVRAGYISSRDQLQIQEIAALPEVHGLMVVGRVDAKTVKVRVK